MEAAPISMHGTRTESTFRHLAALALVLFGVMPTPATAQQADPSCGNPFVNGYGPYDYRTQQSYLKIVEDYHFTPKIEALVSGNQGTVGAELNYTLRAFPNHHRALVAMMRLGERLKTAVPPGAVYSVECFFKRALLFRPDDGVARMLYGKYLFGAGRKNDALKELDYTRETTKDNAFTQYNLGLLYAEFGAADKALEQAHRAMALGFERTDLRTMLQKAGKWRDPPPPPAEAASAAADRRAPEASPSPPASEPAR